MAIICTLVAALIFVLGWAKSFYISLIISLGLGFTIRYTKIWLRVRNPKLNLGLQYVFASLISIAIWVVLPVVYMYKVSPNSVSESLSAYLFFFIFSCVIAAILSYLYYRTEQSFVLQQALDKAEIARVKQDKELLETRLRLLQSQIEPHFLFNTLANIQALIKIEPKMASKMLIALTALLRQSLNRTRDEWLTLSHELRFNKAYLAIQQIRLGDRLSISYEISDKILDTMHFPPMLIQPLIENAVVHGIEPISEGGEIVLSIDVKDKNLIIKITNDCSSDSTQDGHQGHGVGLKNIQERLKQLYGEAAKFTCESQQQRYTAQMEVPVHVTNI